MPKGYKNEVPSDTNLNIRVNSKWKSKLKKTANKERYSVTEYVVKAVDEKIDRGEE